MKYFSSHCLYESDIDSTLEKFTNKVSIFMVPFAPAKQGQKMWWVLRNTIHLKNRKNNLYIKWHLNPSDYSWNLFKLARNNFVLAVRTEKRKDFEKLWNPTLCRNIMVIFFHKAFCPAVRPKNDIPFYMAFSKQKKGQFLVFEKKHLNPFLR